MSLEKKDPAHDFIFYPFLDLSGYDVRCLGGNNFVKLTRDANTSQDVICFNTNGYMKNTWNPINSIKSFNSWTTGTYVKKPRLTSPKIPRIVHQIGIESQAIRKTIEQETGWQYMFWPESTTNKYDVLKKHGGIYLDSKCDLLRALDDSLLVHDFFIGFENEQHLTGLVSSKIMGCVPDCKLLDVLKASISMDDQHNATLLKDATNSFIYPSYYFYPMSRVGDMCDDALILLSYTNLRWDVPESKGSTNDGPGPSGVVRGELVFVPPTLPATSQLETKEVKRPSTLVTPPAPPTPLSSAISSSLHETATLQQELSKLLEDKKITSIADVACGDYSWMQQVKRSDKIRYVGLDKNVQIINSNKQKNGRLEFKVFNAIDERPPNVDLIICRDLLVNLTFEECKRALNNIRTSGSKYVLLTSFPGRRSNTDSVEEAWRPLNLTLAPFSLPTAIQTINEQCTEYNGMYADKSMCLWLCTQIPPL